MALAIENTSDPAPQNSNYVLDLQAITALLLASYTQQLHSLNNVGLDVDKALEQQGNLASSMADEISALATKAQEMSQIGAIFGAVATGFTALSMGGMGAYTAVQGGLSAAKAAVQGVLVIVRVLNALLMATQGALEIAKGVFQSRMTEKQGMVGYLQTTQDNLSSANSWVTGEMKSSLDQERDMNQTTLSAAYAIDSGLSDAFRLRA